MNTIEHALQELHEALSRVSFGSVGVRFIVRNGHVVRVEQEVKTQQLVDNPTD